MGREEHDTMAAGLVLAVGVANGVTRLGLFAGGSAAVDEPVRTLELTTPASLTADEARMQAAAFVGAGADGGAAEVAGCVLSCVVPALVEPWVSGLTALSGSWPVVVGPGVKTGITMRYRDPAELGSDRIANALAARESLGAPVVAVSLGRVLSIEAVDAAGTYLGGIIAPGLTLGARALGESAALLPMVELRAPSHAIGRSTREAIQSGVVLGEAARLDGLLSRVLDEMGTPAPIVVTGEYAAEVAGLLLHPAKDDRTLTLRGLHQLWLQNGPRPRGRRAK